MDKILQEELEIFKIKNQMYGNSFDKSLDKYGLVAGLVRISDKFNRLEKLILTNGNGTADESLEDTLKDMANYCNMLAVYLRNKENKSNEH